MYNQLDSYLENQRDNMIDDIKRLVCINSERTTSSASAPYGEGAKLALISALELAEDYGFKVKNYDNYIGAIDFNDENTQLDILAHLDVVPAGDGWTITEPFVPRLLEGKLYGRGTADDKGPAIAALYAMKAIKELQIPLTKNVRLLLGTDEECGSSDINYYYQIEKEAPMTFSPDGEFPVINIEKGGLCGNLSTSWEEDTTLPRILTIKGGEKVNVVPGKAYASLEGIDLQLLEKTAKIAESETSVQFSFQENEQIIEITAIGRGAHASVPEAGLNALTGLIYLLCKLPLASSNSKNTLHAISDIFPHGDCYGKAAGVAMEDEISGKLTLNFSMLDYTINGFTGIFDSRTPICATKENMLMVIKEKLNKSGIQLNNEEMHPPHCVDSNSAFIQTLLKCYEAYTGEKGECLAIGGGTYVHSLERGVAFGASMPETNNHMHGADEFVIIDDLITSAKIFAMAIVELCS